MSCAAAPCLRPGAPAFVSCPLYHRWWRRYLGVIGSGLPLAQLARGVAVIRAFPLPKYRDLVFLGFVSDGDEVPPRSRHASLDLSAIGIPLFPFDAFDPGNRC
jgi:hypothetical protein